MRTLKCNGWCGEKGEVTHIGSKGYIYCEPCAGQRRASGFENCRRMRKWEIVMLQEGKPLPSYEPKPRPAEVQS